MKILKRLLLVLGIVAGVLALVFVLALLPPVQRALALKFAQQPGTKLDADRIAAGFSGADVGKLRYEMPGVVVTLDSARVDTSLLGLIFGNRIEVANVEARGLVVDLTAPAGPAAPAAVSTGPFAPQGFLALATLPKALLVGRLALDGKIILPDATAAAGARAADFTIASGGIAPDADSTIECRIRLPGGADATTGETTIVVKLRQTVDGQFTSATVTATVKAQVPGQPPVALTAIAELHTDAGGETWTVRVAPGGAREAVLDAKGGFDPQSQVFNGTAKLAAAAPIIAPWLPPDLPAMAADGDATISFNLNTLDWDVRGSFKGSASGLAKLDPRLAGLEPVKIDTEFVARSTGGAIRAESFFTTVRARDDQPLFDARLLRPLVIGADGRPERTSLEGGPIAQIALRGIPLSLAQPFLPEGFQISGGAVTGEFAVTAQGDALVLETVQPLAIPHLHAAMADLPLVGGSDLAAQVRARLDLAVNRATCETIQVVLTPAAGVATPTPALSFTLAQPVVLDLAAGAIVWPKAESRIAAIELRGIPLALAQPFMPEGLTVAGGPVTGELTVSALGEILTFETAKPLAIPGLRAAWSGQPLVLGQDLSLRTRTRLDLPAGRAVCETLRVDLAATGTTVTALRLDVAQPVTLDLAAGAPVLPQNDADLAHITLDHFQVPDISGFVADIALAPLPQITGALTVKATRDGGWTVATPQPLALSPTSLAFVGEPVLEKTGMTVAFDAHLAGDAVTVSRGSLELTTASGRALLADFTGETNLETLAVPRFSLKASGELAPLLAQPVLRGRTSITSGTFAFAADGAVSPAIAAKGRFAMENVATSTIGAQRAGLTVDFDANVSADFLTVAGTTAAEWKVGPRTSAIKASARAAPQGNVSTFEATVAGSDVNLDDLFALATPGGTAASTPAPAAITTTSAAKPTTAPDAAPFWSAYRGAMKVDIQRAVYQGNEITDIGMELAVAADAVTTRRAGLKLAGSPLNAQVSMRFDPRQKARPYVIDGSANGKGIDTGALFKMLQPSDPPLVAMVADLDAKVSGTAANLDTLTDGLNTNVHLVGTKGETRMFAAKSELIAKLGNANTGVGGLLSGLLGSRREKEQPPAAAAPEGAEPKKKKMSPSDYVRASWQLLQFFATTPFDRCEVDASSQGTSEFTVNKLTFTSPVIDIAARGNARIPPGGRWSSLVYQLELTRFGAGGDIGQLLGDLATIAPPKEGETFTYLAKPVPLSGNLAQSNAIQLTALMLDKAQPYLQMLGMLR